jgi:Xaa-Pro aminopeptidase
MFPAQTYIDRRERLKAQFISGLLLFLGNDESPINFVDNAYPFRQDSSFLYYFGIDHPGYAALIDIDENRTVIFGNELTIDDIVFTGVLPTVSEMASLAGVMESAPLFDLEIMLGKAKGREIRFLPPYRSDHRLHLFRLLGIHPDQQADQSSVDFTRAVIEMRILKSPEEIAEIRKAVDISVDMHMAAMRMAHPGIKESAIAAKVTEIALASEGNLGYSVIATVHGETLHNHRYDNTLQRGQVFLLDAGAETAMHYAGDLTSTCPVDSSFTSRQRDLYEIVLGAHLKAIEQLKPDMPFREIHLMACRTMAEGLKALGLMRGDLDAAVELGAHAMFFQCGLGHVMGLDVHDMENLGEVWVGYEGRPKSTLFGIKSLRLARPLKPGFVLTVEPGLYFIPELIDRWRAAGKHRDYINYDRLDAYRDAGGFRIEEDLLITQDGSEILGKPRPRTVQEVEAAKE